MSKILNDIVDLAKRIQQSQNENKIDDLEQLTDSIKSFPDYFNSVINMAIASETLRFRYETKEYQERMESLDSARRLSHESATISVNKINAFCKEYGKEPIFELDHRLDFNDVDDRELAADLVYGFCKEVFLEEKVKERYNEIENVSHTQRDREVHNMISDRVGFKNGTTLDDLISQAQEEIKKSEKPTSIDDDFCL